MCKLRLLFAIFPSIALGACASVVPSFDIPVDPRTGAPTVQSIVRRVTCELAGLLDDNYGLKGALLISDIQVALQLNLTVNWPTRPPGSYVLLGSV